MTRALEESLYDAAMQLAVLRESVRQRAERIASARRAFELGIAHELDQLATDKAQVETAEAAVRGMALLVYDAEGQRKPAPGVEVILQKEYDIDEASGLTWAKATGMCLVPQQLDLKAVKKMATVVPLPFVEVRERPAVRIASDLLRALGNPTTDMEDAA